MKYRVILTETAKSMLDRLKDRRIRRELVERMQGLEVARADVYKPIAHTGRFAEALRTGQFAEVEPYPSEVMVAIDVIVDACEWHHELPRKQR